MTFFRILLLAIRPKTLSASIAPVLIGTAMALKSGSFDLLTFLFTLATGVEIQIATNLANDYFDFKKGADRPTRIGPVRVMQAKLLSEIRMKKWIFTNALLILLTGSFLIYKGGLVFSFLLILAILCAIFYTAGPFSIAYLGLGELFVFIFFGPVAVVSTYYLQVHEIHLLPMIVGCAIGLLSCGILMINNIRDIPEDRVAKKITLAVRIGEKNGKRLYASFLILATLLPFALYREQPLIWLAGLTLVPALYLIKEVFAVEDPRHYNPLLAKSSKLLMVFTWIFAFSWMI